jgi:capsid protein
MTKSVVLDWSGQPFQVNGHSKKDIGGLLTNGRNRRVKAKYDAAQDTDEYSRYWAGTDTLDSDSANSTEVRRKLVARSRYEVQNNGFVDGMVQTYANFLVGLGPSLRMETGNDGFNSVVELIWYQWAQAINLRRKLWCTAHAKLVDGEGFGVAVDNPLLPTRITLDWKLIETEQVQSSFLTTDRRYEDGIHYDEFGNIDYYDILPYHPGGSQATFFNFNDTEKVSARFVTHWFAMRRPGQHRGIPEFTSTLQVGASSRRMREATVSAVEAAATLGAILLQTGLAPTDVEQLLPMSTTDTQRGMITALPAGYTASQMDAKHPNAQYAEFLRSQINEQARPKSLPYNLAACDSSSYNYASGRLDHQTFFAQLDVERQDCNALVLDKLFQLFWEEAVFEYGWKRTPPPSHSWDWPKHPIVDQKSEASSNDTRFRNGSLTITRHYADQGLDPQDEFTREAAFWGISLDEYKARLLDTLMPVKAPPQVSPLNQAIEEEQNANSAS